MLADITPVILTYNEAANIGRSLERLTWAREVVIVDSGSTDDTLAIAGRFPNARVVHRPFDSHARQWRFATDETGVTSGWILRLDADYMMEPALRDEIAALVPDPATAAYRDRLHLLHRRQAAARLALSRAARAVPSRPRGASSRTAIPRSCASTARLYRSQSRLLHDDRKSLERWLQSQSRYQAAEAEKLATRPWSELSWPDRLRCTRVLGPVAVAVHCLFVKGLIFDGTRRSLLYSAACDGRHDPFHAPAASRPRQMTYVLGLNAYHADAAACLVKDGDLVAAVEEERFRRIKHWGGFPSESIRYCLEEAGISLADVGHVAVNSDNAANRWRKLGYVLTSGVSPSYIIKRLRHRGDRADVAGNLQRALPDEKFTGTVHAVEHHLCHLASAFLVSPYDKAVAVSVDGFGDFSSAAWGLGEGGTLAVDGRVYFPHSLGVFYEAMTQFIGFPHYGDEYKVMGLAPYGQPPTSTR